MSPQKPWNSQNISKVHSRGLLTPNGADRLGVPHLAGQEVSYLSMGDDLGEFALEIMCEGLRLGSNLSIPDGIQQLPTEPHPSARLGWP